VVSRARAVRLIVSKELLEMVRDRRTMVTALVLPLLAFPLLFGVMGYLSNPTANPSPVYIVNLDTGSYSSTLTNNLQRTTGLSITVVSSGNVTAAVQSGRYDVGLTIPSDFSSSMSEGGRVNLTLFYEQTNGRALQGVTIIDGVVTSLSQQISSARLALKGVTNAELNPIGVVTSQVGKSESASLLITADLFPSFLLYFTFLGAFYFMVDDIAGEKERRSLEALFTLPPSRATIFLGKYTVAFLLAMVTTVLGLVGTLFSLSELNFAGAGPVSLPLSFYPEVLAVVALAALSMCALGFCISTFAKNIREAQQYLTPLFFIFFLPLYFTFSLPSSQLSQYASVPLVGFTLLIRDLVLGTATLGEVGSAVLVNVIFLTVLLWLGMRLLNSEKIILRSG
jgi:ABC-type Na+ efflux pump permease subunit